MDNVYIVANKNQELNILRKFEKRGVFWLNGATPTEWLPSEKIFVKFDSGFPYVLVEENTITWKPLKYITDDTIIFDGRKEDKMNKKYLVTQEFMGELIKWRDNYVLDATLGSPLKFVDGNNINDFSYVVRSWWTDIDNPIENNNRLIAIIQWLNGEDVFEVESPHKFVVRSDKSYPSGNHRYVMVDEGVTDVYHHVEYATKFDTREEAQEWANSHQVVVEIDEEGNEVE